MDHEWSAKEDERLGPYAQKSWSWTKVSRESGI